MVICMETVSPALAYELLALLLVIENGVWKFYILEYECMALLSEATNTINASVTIPTERIEMYVNSYSLDYKSSRSNAQSNGE